ncbi:hypothetical protein [Rhodococcus sp. ACPA1]|uniref:hypothetical protein n=1 Tax=Rhodococcus sp. ACPA1 TaxID=2028572 RepID=UPI000BB15FAC|nr:hypothetical protein CJ177_10480 [Rhodococcus sp. ACPA1]
MPLEGYPGCGAIVYDALRAAMFVRALHTEMMARNAYIHHKKIEGSQLPLMIAVLDEFFILSGKWQRLAKTGDDATRERLEELDPRATRGTRPESDSRNSTRSGRGPRARCPGVPDASLFGGASGNPRDNPRAPVPRVRCRGAGQATTD